MLRLSGRGRRDQVEAVLDDARAWSGPVVIAGDFNGSDLVGTVEDAGYRHLTRDVHGTLRGFLASGSPLITSSDAGCGSPARARPASRTSAGRATTAGVGARPVRLRFSRLTPVLRRCRHPDVLRLGDAPPPAHGQPLAHRLGPQAVEVRVDDRDDDEGQQRRGDEAADHGAAIGARISAPLRSRRRGAACRRSWRGSS